MKPQDDMAVLYHSKMGGNDGRLPNDAFLGIHNPITKKMVSPMKL